ncbi:hypothetical protein EPUL_005855, partial [Erysiphe pulchra]
NTTTKTKNSNKSFRTIFSSFESTRKAEAIRNALGALQNIEKETPSGNDIQINDPFESPSPSADAPDIHTIQTPNLQLETPTVSNIRNNVRVASLDLDYPGSDGNSSDDDLIYEDPPHDKFSSASGKIKEALLSISEAASLRILEARELFDTISGILDEPYIFRDRTRRITKHHPSYDSFLPTDDWVSARPRVISYVRKVLSLHPEQIYTKSSDILPLRLKSPTGKSLFIFNVYNNNSLTPGGQSAIQALFTLPKFLYKGNFLLQGDFNLHHIRWQLSWPRSPSPGAENFVEWVDQNNLILLSPLDKATHNRGNVLDLALGTGTLLYKLTCCIASHLDSTSDHLPLLTTIGWEIYHDIQTNTAALDKLAKSLTEALRVAYSGSARRSIKHGKGKPWWNSECKMARREYKSKVRINLSIEEHKNARKEYRKVIRKAKTVFYKAKVEEASTAKDVFAILKWHKTGGTYRSSLSLDPRYPELPPVTTLSEKRKILLNNLLVHTAETGDIPIDSPAVPARSLEFSPLTEHEIQESLFRAHMSYPET